ncbi:PleD family two-component system response regulator [Pelomonas sp. KK5]|uniref:response regulator n=1 Tax=Pelomonas sp. KK5 TaxID=1855730 RepID=UPI00097CBFED|nr:response regulator [Pelomonas sp. KK5]
MLIDLSDGLSSYLLPFLIAVPLALVVFFISGKRGEDGERRPSTRAPAPAPAPAMAPAARVAAPVPAPLAAAAPVVAAPTPAPAPAGPPSLLLVDDSAVARAKLGKLFEGAGYKVTLAKDGDDALVALSRERFQVLITDLEMPNKDGFELIAAVQGSIETEDMPVIAITGHDEMSARVHQVQGIYGIYKKPWNDRELLKRVETLAALRKA